MAKLILNGATSGSVTLESPAVSGTTTLTLPTTSGTVGIVSGDLGTPSALVGTNISGTSNSFNAGVGVNQTWQSVTRLNGTTYTNSTGKPIMLHVVVAINAAGNFTMVVGGVTFPTVTNPSGTSSSFSVIIPNGSTYSYTGTAGNSFTELR